jgi:putative Mg2+ transporter-C (MgtC) family protein
MLFPDRVLNMDFFQLEWLQFVFKMLMAFILALPIGWNRERHTRTMGIRTFPLVALGSTAYVLISLAVLRGELDAQARIIQGLITGIGFVGGGAILKDPAGSVRGTATAVSVWTTGALGIAVAYGRFDIVIIISLVNYLTLRIMTDVKNNIHKEG